MNQLSAVLSGSLREGRDKFSQGRYLMEEGEKIIRNASSNERASQSLENVLVKPFIAHRWS